MRQANRASPNSFSTTFSSLLWYLRYRSGSGIGLGSYLGYGVMINSRQPNASVITNKADQLITVQLGSDYNYG